MSAQISTGNRELEHPIGHTLRSTWVDAAKPAERLPDFLVIGAAKSGTTTLSKMMMSHPHICPISMKEPCYFDINSPNSQRGIEWYRSLFASTKSDQICGEFSTNYTMWPLVPDAPRRIASLMPNVKLIYIIRDPIERSFAHYAHRHQKEFFPAQPFRFTFEQFCLFDPVVIHASDYYAQIQEYLNWFPKTSLLVLLLSELQSRPSAVLSRVFNFLGVEDLADSLIGQKVMENSRSQFSQDMARTQVVGRITSLPYVRKVARSLPGPVRESCARILMSSPFGKRVRSRLTPPPMRPETQRALKERFARNIDPLSQIVGTDLRSWVEV